MRTVRQCSIAGIASLVLGCASVNVGSDYDRGARFARVCTFDWSETTADQRDQLAAINPFLERGLRHAVEDRLRQSGYEQRGEEEVDFLVTSFVVGAPRDEDGRRGYRDRPSRAISIGIGVGFGHRYPRFGFARYGGYWDPFFGYPFFGYPTFGYPFFALAAYPLYGSSFGYLPSYYPHGAHGRFVEGRAPGTLVVDIADGEGELIWRGWAEAAFWDPPVAEEMAAYVDDMVARILARFPPEGMEGGCATAPDSTPRSGSS
ncbi:MAG: DUF4136 domain-containing protein [Gemmatimonadota bacterium]